MKRKELKKRPAKRSTQKRLSSAGKAQAKGSSRSNPTISTKRKSKTTTGAKNFPVVAIGASAGGIEAISKLLENLSPDLGMCYVIIQHLAPDHESILPELLEKKNTHARFPGKGWYGGESK